MKKCSFLNGSFAPGLTAYNIGLYHRRMGKPELTNGSTSVGIIYERDKFGSLIQVKRIEGKLFESKEHAEAAWAAFVQKMD